MVFVFGIDIPLVEMIFVLTLILVLLLALLIYVVVILNKLNERLKEILRKENLELRGLKTIEEKEQTEIGLLRKIWRGMVFKKTPKRKPKPRKRRYVRRKPVKKRRVRRDRFIHP
ncbi:hypothetical protein KY332_05300 [Candidatus Woesearchaeota archaeon]|nr:hypothetical protein [Candidatus Woesearchaeota archaeon]